MTMTCVMIITEYMPTPAIRGTVGVATKSALGIVVDLVLTDVLLHAHTGHDLRSSPHVDAIRNTV